MSEHNDDNVVIETTPGRPHYVALMVGLSIIISLILVTIAMWLYNASGTAQLDLSAPAYKQVRKQVARDIVEDFSSTGILDRKTVDEFRKLYDEQTSKATQVDGFGNQALSDDALGLSELQPPAESTQ